MANIKDIFKIIIVLQLLACALATYGHPDAEVIDFGSPTQPSRDELIIEAAIKRGMDGEAVAELLRTRRPVVRTTTTPSGFTKTTTYKLEPDGSISSKSMIQKRHRYVYNSDSIPDDLKNSPTGTVTRTFTDSDGNKVTQTIAVNREKPLPDVNTDALGGDWFNKPFSSWPEETLTSPQYTTNHRTISRTFTAPNGERTTVQSWSSEPEPSHHETPFTTSNDMPNFRRTSTRTYTNPNGGKHNVQTTSTKPTTFDTPKNPKFPPIDDINWPSFDDPTFDQTWGNAEPDGESWEVVDPEPEVTTKKNLKPWAPKTWEWPEFPTHPTTTTTTTTPKLYIEPEPTTRKPLPSLDAFLKSQYGQPTNRESTTTTTKTFTHTPKSVSSTTPKASPTSPKFIKIEDLPVVEVLHNGKPADESLLKTLPAHLTPRTPAETVRNIEHKHPIEEDMGDSTSTVEKNIRSYSKTHIGPEKPRLKDLDPQMQDILRNAGIVPEIEGDAVTKTRTEPDGRVITTTYKVNTMPSTSMTYTPAVQHYSPTLFNSYQPSVPLSAFQPQLSPIAEFLARLGLTKFDISSRNGHYSKTFVDEDGDVLTATFVLSSHKNKGRHN